MEAYHTSPAVNGPGLCGSDREIFERVWRRVMPTDTYGCPVQLIGEEPLSQVEPQPYTTEGDSPVPWPPEPPLTTTPCPVCLGPSSAPHGAQLQAFIASARSGQQWYLTLSKRTKGNPSRMLSGMAAERHRQAKRLTTAYFLISGVHYWPDLPPAPPPVHPLPACLRQAFLSEQEEECAYRMAAEQTADPCLRELYLDFAGQSHSHAWVIRSLLEG